ncbi:hypothetical protein ACFQZ4_39595 [Catellatospora coxensis]
MSGLPAVTAPALAETLDALPGRLRKKVDDAVTRAAAWPVSTADGQVTVTVDESTTVTLVLTGGVVRTGADARCSCLLAPNCLHRVAVLALAPVHDGLDDEPEPAGSGGAVAGSPVAGGSATADSGLGAADGQRPGAAKTGDAGSSVAVTGDVAADGGVPGGEPVVLPPRQREAAEGLWRAAAAVLAAGTSGSGLVLRTALLRAVHEGRANGLHRAAAAGTRVAAGLQALREAQPQFRLAELTDDLREVLTVAHRLRAGELPAEQSADLLGVARRGYDPQAGLRLYGLCTVPVVAESGYAGTVTYVADRDGRLWTVTDVAPGGADRAARSGDTVVALGEAGLSHRQLTRAGMIVSGVRRAPRGGSARAGRCARCGPPERPGPNRRSARCGNSRWTSRSAGPSARWPSPSATGWPAPTWCSCRCACAARPPATPCSPRPSTGLRCCSRSRTTTRSWPTATTCGCSERRRAWNCWWWAAPTPAGGPPSRHCRSGRPPAPVTGCACRRPGPPCRPGLRPPAPQPAAVGAAAAGRGGASAGDR